MFSYNSDNTILVYKIKPSNIITLFFPYKGLIISIVMYFTILLLFFTCKHNMIQSKEILIIFIIINC